ncbi:histidine ammonia-lyase/tyrosine ammonia-lyase [Amycolatopsis bartoniae]|uniref:Histidine ammonia-lyase n=1 Tax=Amycolatopsis bartoniae TaxID=941986 RepID=A0A8H9J166_9PSEU|nr:aromatic amino acid ammonia-lyase [Amycolatopsis bartoniae]MBB2936137.1 histidine ammonia-lyase/tyrosine ammonia-lyase [Amycolatopsis bartoniae]TVT07149.1 aromatic amino acid lyase [Amycolatopsis bartoniae]GHF81297.1 histidine ammonia-lyase [Amycolatopsis bartoniae]
MSLSPATSLPTRLDAALLERAARPLDLELPAATRAEVDRGRTFVDRCLSGDHAIYGSTTGFGPLVAFAGRDTAADQCDNVLQHLTAGQGPDLPPELVRATVLARLWSLARGRSGVSGTVLDALCAMLRTTFAPAVPTLGSVGASGDLVPLAHIAQALRGHGYAYLDGRRLPAEEALREAGLAHLPLDGRDALGFVNGTSLTTAAAALAWTSISRSLKAAAALTALLADLLGCAPAFLAPQLLKAYGHPAVIATGERMAALLAGVRPEPDRPLQEPYSIRCSPQLLGAAASAVEYAGSVVDNDLNGVSDNPLFFEEDDLIAHGGNFFGQPCAFAADLLAMVATQTGNLAERQLDLLVDPHRNGGLPPMLSPEPGRQHGLQGVQVVTTAVVVDMRRRATPASFQSVPTNLHNQDVVPFGTQAALNALSLAGSLRLLHGSLALGLRQAVFVGARRPTAPACVRLFDELAAVLEPVERDRPLDTAVRAAADLLDAHLADA